MQTPTEPSPGGAGGPAGRPLPAALEPLRGPVFRGLWLAWVAANVTMWSHDVAAAWLMTSLTDSAVMVALVQTASTLPVFLLGLPAGAAADIVDRRRFLAGTQLWVSANAALLALLAMADALNAPLLLLLTFTNGIGLAMRWPVFAAIVPEVVPRAQLSAALGLNAVAMNVSRVFGPVAAGALLAAAGPAAVFTMNLLLALFAFAMILRWKSAPRASTLPGERFLGAMRVGLQHVRQSPRMRAVVVRVFLFFLQAGAMLALLPLIARRDGGGAGLFTALMASMGAGAVIAALSFQHWRDRFPRDRIVSVAMLLQGLFAALLGLVPHAWFAIPCIALAGAAWITCANTLAMSAQLALPAWVRARGMASYQVALMGGTAFGAALWGKVAGWFGVDAALVIASAVGAACVWAVRGLSVGGEGAEIDHTPAAPRTAPEVVIPVEPDDGPVMVTVQYEIDPARAADFAAVMHETRAARLRQGALSWGLFRDTSVPGRYVEYFVDENWLEHQRRLERFTAADAELRERRLGFHVGTEPPLLRRYVAEAPGGEGPLTFG